MLKNIFAVGGITILLTLTQVIWAEEESFLDTPAGVSANATRGPTSALPLPSLSKRNYPGGADEEDLQVQRRLPEAGLKTDARSLQREIYKGLYNQELKDDRQEDVEE